MQTFKSVLGNIIDEVAKKFGYNKEQLGQIVERGISEANTGADVGTVLQETLSKLIKPQIVTGLDVTATLPPSLSVLVSPGYGSAQGLACELKTQQNITIDNNLSLYYIVLNGSRVTVSASLGLGLPIAKVVIPYPRVTNKILNDKNPESEYDGYIISGKDLLFDNNFIIDDESIAQLKNTMSKIFAEYIFGTIKLNESLKITNEQGTMSADSQSIKFYNVNGDELAYYGGDEARIGNIKVTPTTVQSRDFQEGVHGFRLKDNGDAEFDDITARGTLSSPNFSSGPSGQGWQINRAGDATFNNGLFRGELHTSVFVKDSINATNGNLVVTNATVLASDVAVSDTSIVVKEAVFSVGDRVRIKPDVTRSEYMSIDSANGTTYGVTRNLDGSGANSFQAGDAVVGQGSRVEIVASGDTAANLPYIDVIKRNSTTWNDTSTMVRLGNLAGITDAQFGTLSGYGLYTNNGYFTGSVKASNFSGGTISGTSSSIGATARFVQTANSVTAYDTNNNSVFNTTLTGTNAGDTYLGNWSSGKGVYWNMSSGTLSIKLSTQTRKYVVDRYAFKPANSGYGYDTGAGNGYLHNLTTIGSSVSYYANCNLPNGSIVTSIKAYYYKDNAAADGYAGFIRCNTIGQLGTLAQIQLTGSSGNSSLEDTSIDNPIIDNENYAYSAYCSFNPASATDEIGLYTIVVTYTVIDPLP
jgi:hypothetical protein